jgi:hypothetical protein
MEETVIAPAWKKRLSKEAARPKHQVQFNLAEVDPTLASDIDMNATIVWTERVLLIIMASS